MCGSAESKDFEEDTYTLWAGGDLETPERSECSVASGGALEIPSHSRWMKKQRLLVRPRRKMWGPEEGGHCWREEMGHCEAKVSFWGERAITELCPKPMKEATTEFPVSQEEWASVSDTCKDRERKPLSQASRVPLEERVLSCRSLICPSSLHHPQHPSWKATHRHGLCLYYTFSPASLPPSNAGLHPQILHSHSFPVPTERTLTHIYSMSVCARPWAGLGNVTEIQHGFCLFSTSGLWIQRYFLPSMCLSIPPLFSPPYLFLGCLLESPLLAAPVLQTYAYSWDMQEFPFPFSIPQSFLFLPISVTYLFCVI